LYPTKVVFSFKALLIFTFITVLPARAEDLSGPPSSFRAASELMMAFGTDGIRALDERGLILLAGDEKTGRRLLSIEEDLLSPLDGSLEAAEAFLGRFDAIAEKRPEPKTELEDLRKLQSLPLSNVITRRVRTVLDLMGWELASARRLGKDLDAVRNSGGLFKTPWGEELLARTRPIVRADAGATVELLFEFLGGSGFGAGPREKALGYIKEVHKKDISEALTRDLEAGVLSDEVRASLGRYIEEESILWSLERAHAALMKSSADPKLLSDLKGLRLLAAGLRRTPGAFKKAAATLAAAGKGRARFSAPGLEVHNTDTGGVLRVGDSAAVSIAYWISGLSKGQSAPVTEAGFVDLGSHGISDRTQRLVERKNGGPYIYSVQVPIRSSRDLDYRFFLNSPDGATTERKVLIEVSPDYEELLERGAGAEEQAARCRLPQAADSLKDSISRIPDDAPAQYKDFRDSIKDRAKDLERRFFEEGDLKNAVDGAKLFASKAECRFRGDRAQRALHTLKGLPAGCDGLPEDGAALGAVLLRLDHDTRARQERQETFLRTVARAREMEQDCRPMDAAGLYASALALLEADPATRCGEPEEEHTVIRLGTLPRSASAGSLAGGLEKILSRAEARFAKEDYAGALQLTIPLAAAIDSIPESGCFAATRAKAVKLAEAAGVALGPKTPSFPKDRAAALEKELEKRWQEKIAAERAAARREQLRQSPLAPEEEP